MGNKTKTSIINYYDNELDNEMAEAMEQFAQYNVRFRSPNRNNGPTHQQKNFKPNRET